MTDLPFLTDDAAPAMLAPAGPRKHRHAWAPQTGVGRMSVLAVDRKWVPAVCIYCGAERDAGKSKRGRNNRKRGNAAELTVARGLNARKMGPLGLPWDVEMPGYARLQVRKYATPQGLRKIAAELARIGSGAEMPGYIWIEPGRGGERLIVFRLVDFAERHGVPTGGDE